MSLAATSPLIANWIEKGLEWRYFWNPIIRPTTIPAKGQIQIPSAEYTFTAPEGTLLSLSAGFYHPKCGWRVETDREFDTGTTFTVNNAYSQGVVNQPYGVFVTAPPATPTGYYLITLYKEINWVNWMRLYLVNTDTIAHRCFGYAYWVAYLTKTRDKTEEKES